MSKKKIITNRRNALKSEFYTRELVVNPEEQPEFEALRKSLRDQFTPATTMQQLSFEEIVCLYWRCKLALRLEARAMGLALGAGPENGEKGDPQQGVTLSQWVGTSNQNLRSGIRFLKALRADVAANGLIHLEKDGPCKDSVVKGLGQPFYDSLVEWKEFNVPAIQLIQALDAHRRNFPSLSDPLNPSDQTTVVPDPKLKWDMVVKLIDLQVQHLHELLATNASRQLANAQADVCPRYFADASLDLRRAVEWYLYLRDMKL
jgi:hypothetical protein